MQEVTKDELLNGYLRQQDYTRKTQEIAEVRKQKEQEATKGDETEEVKKTLKQLGFATKDEIQEYVVSLARQQTEEQKLSNLIQSNPELKQFE
jgi:Holliday junction resolvasome RuvABC DNA-binding subunit